jgi:hypothetical protein
MNTGPQHDQPSESFPTNILGLLPPATRTSTALGLFVLGAGLLVLALSWTTLGTAYYQRVLPFYDSLSYQQQHVAITQQYAREGFWSTVGTVWREGGNTALNRFSAALFGGILANTKEGLYVYLFSIHFAAIIALLVVTWRATTSLTWAILAVSAWLAALPFAEAINGILDQRMDLASGAFCLLLSALCLSWSWRPSVAAGLIAGLAGALAVLHRPVMAVTVAGIMVIFWIRSILRQRQGLKFWLVQLGAMAAPGLVITLPWIWTHAAGLKFYYLIWNVAVGNAGSSLEAAQYNLGWFAHAVGSRYAIIVAAALAWGIYRKMIDWLDLAAVALAIVFPLLILIVSRSVGNFLVSQIPLGLPALMLACLRPMPERSPARSLLATIGACALFLGLIGTSLSSLKAQIAGVPVQKRIETMRVLNQIESQTSGSRRVLCGFQTIPLDPNGLVALAREQGMDLSIGRLYFHPVDFGISNAEAPSLTEAERQGRFAAILQQIKASSTLLMLPTAESLPRLPPDPYSHVHMQEIRRAVEADKDFVLRLTTAPIDGISLEIYAVNPPTP